MDILERINGAKYRELSGERKHELNEIVNNTVKLYYFFKLIPVQGRPRPNMIRRLQRVQGSLK